MEPTDYLSRLLKLICTNHAGLVSKHKIGLATEKHVLDMVVLPSQIVIPTVLQADIPYPPPD